MDDRTRSFTAVAGTIGLFLCIQLGALALLDPYVATGAQPVDDPSNAGNVAYFFGVILVATAGMLAAIKFGLERLIRGFVLLSCGWICWIVLDTILTSLEPGDLASGTTATALENLAIVIPFAVAGGLVIALFVYPEWYVIDAAGVLLGAGAAGLFGLAFTPELTVLFLLILAAYDAISVYGTEHMLALAEGVTDLNVPVLLVVPTTTSFSLLSDDGPATLDDGETSDEQGDSILESEQEKGHEQEEMVGNSESEDDEQEAEQTEAAGGRDAIYIGLGDAVMPTILVVSAAYFLRDSAPLFDVPLLAINLPALTALVGTLIGLSFLLRMVLKGRAHAGLPMLNGGAIGGYLIGAVASGIGLVEALGLPL
ncbi:presenilin family intramembrane aspartyl protease PSH [Salinarchaeum laminariae]|uniref:presenilin family intramembrane aspartyl protease PSH n=1 Tax=Salinarchaeum laminariae TaxID=869888 RepID=UPI0020BEA648|nr:presenilin family intramembrane aspartyl protease PSH [Salinarchaeum laminariae]